MNNGAMTAQPSASPQAVRWAFPPTKSTPWTYEDLERHTPPDSYGFEILEGVLAVSPMPDLRHLWTVRALLHVLDASCPLELIVAPGSYDFQFGDSTVAPDLFVIDPHKLGMKRGTVPPLLAVEVLSPSGRAIDLGSKRLIYERAGVPDYWVVDPRVPSLLALHLQDGRYVEDAHVAGDQPFTAATPFPVQIVPSRLLDELPA